MYLRPILDKAPAEFKKYDIWSQIVATSTELLNKDGQHLTTWNLLVEAIEADPDRDWNRMIEYTLDRLIESARHNKMIYQDTICKALEKAEELRPEMAQRIGRLWERALNAF